MNRDDIIRMAREVGYSLYDFTETDGLKIVESDEEDEWAQLERFAALVAAAERERCALICEEVAQLESEQWALDGACAAHECAQRIREAV